MSESKVQQEETTKSLELMNPQELLAYAQELLKENEKLASKRIKYGLVWEDHDEDIVKQCREKLPVLQEVKERFVQGAIKISPAPVSVQLDAFDTSIVSNANVGSVLNAANVEKPTENINHILIEADNYHALSVLNYTHKGKIDVIYIDPPYNTGNNDFIYNDRFVDKNDTFRHSKWISFMEKRLKLAKDLLKDTGVIFISIDDNEVANLRLLCDSVFNPSNFLGCFTINTTPNARDYGHIGKMHDFCLFYALNAELTQTNQVKDNDKKFKYEDAKGGYNIHPLYNSNVAFHSKNRPNLFYPFYVNLEKSNESSFFEIGLSPFESCIEVFPPLSVKDNVQFVWRWGKDKSKSELNEEILGYKTETGDYRIVQKMRNSTKIVRSLLLDSSFSSRRGTAQMEEIFNKKIFSFPKPIDLIKQFIDIATNPNSTILDFFAGSGTTAHAVMQLNAEDGGNRQCILVTNNENNICEEVTFERCKRVIEGYTNLKGEQVAGLAGNNLRYYKTDFVENTLNSDQLKFSITNKCTEMLCLRENVFDLFLENKNYKVFKQENKYLAIFYDMYSAELLQLRDVMNDIEGEKVLYFFSLDRGTPDSSEFSDWKGIKIEPIPQKILDLYKQLFRQK